MAKEKSKESRIKRLYKRLNAHPDQPVTRQSRHHSFDVNGKPIYDVRSTKIILTQQGRIEHAIQTLENAKK